MCISSQCRFKLACNTLVDGWIYENGSTGPLYEVKAGEGMLSQSSSDVYIGALDRISVLDIYFKGQKVKSINNLEEGLNVISL